MKKIIENKSFQARLANVIERKIKESLSIFNDAGLTISRDDLGRFKTIVITDKKYHSITSAVLERIQEVIRPYSVKYEENVYYLIGARTQYTEKGYALPSAEINVYVTRAE